MCIVALVQVHEFGNKTGRWLEVTNRGFTGLGISCT